MTHFNEYPVRNLGDYGKDCYGKVENDDWCWVNYQLAMRKICQTDHVALAVLVLVDFVKKFPLVQHF